MEKQKLKKSLNLISLQNDVLNEKEMENLFGGRHDCDDCDQPLLNQGPKHIHNTYSPNYTTDNTDFGGDPR